MSVTELEVSEKSFTVEEKKKINVIPLIFKKPEYEEEETKSKIAFSISTLSLDKLEETDTIVIEKELVSTVGTRYLSIADVSKTKTLPRWKYEEPSNVVTLREVLNTVSEYLKGHSFYTTAMDVADFTKVKNLNQPFKVARQLMEAVEKSTTVRAVHLLNDKKGIDILAEVSSSDGSSSYKVLLHIGTDKKGKPKIYHFCSCPMGEKSSTICKHVMAVIASRPHIILGAVDYLAEASKPINYYIDYWKTRTSEVLKKLNTPESRAGFIYYLTRFLMNKGDDGLLAKITLGEPEKGELEALIDMVLKDEKNALDRLKDLGFVETKDIEKTRREMRLGSGSIVKIKWTPEMDEMRKRIVEVIDELGERFGLQSYMRQGEWPTLLVYSMVMSADYNKPPIVLHAVGDIGTFKTTGAKLLSEYIRMPEIVATYKGNDVVDKYRAALTILSKYFDISVSELENRVGGVISQLQTSEDSLVIGFSLPYLLSIAKEKPDGKKILVDFRHELEDLGFTISTRYSKPKIAIIDPAQLGNIEDYRMKYLPDKNLGLLTQMDVFDNYILVIDEGSRNPHGLETLLTKMSISSVTEGVRIILITDNIEPFQEVISNPRYAPLHDRTYKVMTRAIRDDITVMQNLFKEPKYRFSSSELLAVQKFIESIPIPEGVLYLAKAIGNALEYKYTQVSIKRGVKHLRPVKRDERTAIQLDIFSGAKFKFIAGGRFVHHTLMLSKFFAFLNKHEYVTINDFRKALIFTIKSRLVVDAVTYKDYKIQVMDVISKIDDILSDSENILEPVLKFIATVKNATPEVIRDEFDMLNAEANLKHFLAPAIMSALEIVSATGSIDMDKLPDNVKYSLIELKIEKGDFTDLDRYPEIVREIIRSREMEVKAR